MEWKLRTDLTPHQDGCQNYLYNVVPLDDDGNAIPAAQEKYFTDKEAIARAKFLVSTGQRCDVTMDIAASYGVTTDCS